MSKKRKNLKKKHIELKYMYFYKLFFFSQELSFFLILNVMMF